MGIKLQPSTRLMRSAAAAMMIALSAAGCARLSPPSQREGDDVFDEIHTASYGSSTLAGRRVEKLPASARKAKFFFLARTAPRRPMRKVGKVDPTLQDWIANRPSTDVVEVVITFTDTVRMSRFPRLDRKLSRDHPDNRAQVDSADRLIARLRQARAPRYTLDTLDLKTSFNATILQTYWLLQAALIRVELGKVGSISTRPNVMYVRPNIGPGPPQDDAIPGNDTWEARDDIGSDHYLELGFGTGWMALLDTGVHTSHWLLFDATTATKNLCMVADCVPWATVDMGGYACSDFSQEGATAGGGDNDPKGHGTCSAAILVGNGRELPRSPGTGGRFGGVTRATLDCFKVYAESDNKLRPHAAFLGFQAALARANQLVVAEMQDTTEDMADVARVADQAYEGGVVVIAAAGNEREWGVGVPARGKRVIGAGAYMIERNVPIGELARGPTPDSLIKPEILAPSHSETAGIDPKKSYPEPIDAMKRFGYTSGATPYAAGAAFLLQNWLDMKEGVPVEAGQVYAHLLLSGDEVGPFPPDDATGVGLMKLPKTGTGKYGKTWVSKETRFMDVPIEIDASAGVRTLAAAIWWPESTQVESGAYVDTHNDIDLEIVSPGLFGSVEATSDGRNGVFERATVTRPGGISGKWILRIRPKTYRTVGNQVVYWGASLSRDGGSGPLSWRSGPSRPSHHLAHSALSRYGPAPAGAGSARPTGEPDGPEGKGRDRRRRRLAAHHHPRRPRDRRAQQGR